MTFAVTLPDLRKAGACISGYNKVVRMIEGKPFSDADQCRNTYIRLHHEEPVNLADVAKNNGIDDALWALRCVPSCERDARLFAVWCARQTAHLMEDDRSKAALDVSERFANGEATEEELSAAWSAAESAAWSAAWSAARSAARSAAWSAARSAQLEMFLKMCAGEAPWQVVAIKAAA